MEIKQVILSVMQNALHKKEPQLTNAEILKQGLARCPHCSQYTHKGNYCEQCGHKMISCHKSV